MSPRNRKPASCILLMGRHEYLNGCALSFAQQAFDVLAVIRHKDALLSEDDLCALQPDYVFSFLNEKILKGNLLCCKNVNFHPAPPEWPGRGSASLALYHGSTTFGATAHLMSASVDSGPILSVKRFSIIANESCESLFSRAENACLDLFYEILTYITEHGNLPQPSGDAWARRAITRKQFEEWLILNPDDHEDFIRKINASRHSTHPGPYVFLHGYKFALISGRKETP